MKMNVKGNRGRGKPKNRWLDTIENDMRAVNVCSGDVGNQGEWNFWTRTVDPK
jgi:hypothetical protein